jgi:hypothetical protein
MRSYGSRGLIGGGARRARGISRDFSAKEFSSKKLKYVKTQKTNKRKNFGDTTAAGSCPCPEADGVRLHRLKRERSALAVLREGEGKCRDDALYVAHDKRGGQAMEFRRMTGGEVRALR